MASKRRDVGKGKAGASSSAAGDVPGGPPGSLHPGRAQRRNRAQMERDEEIQWRESIKGRGVKNERHIELDGGWPEGHLAIEAIKSQGMSFWFEPNPGYNNALVEEFYKCMVVPEAGTFLNPGARITSVIGKTPVFIDVDKIAAALNYVRPEGETNFPRPVDDPIDQDWVKGEIYTHRREARVPHWPGKFKPAYRFLNQVVCYNIFPRGTENKPQEKVGNIMWAFTGEDTVCDWALFIFGEMVDFRAASKIVRMPFPCLVTTILRRENVPGARFYVNDRLDPGVLDSTILRRSSAQTKGGGESLLAPPSSEAPLKDWLRKIFCQNVAIIKSQKKIKLEQRQMARKQVELDDQLSYVRQHVTGETSGSYVPRKWPELEVSDDFVEQGTPDEDSDAFDG